jgi:hypothetical protein
MGDSLAHDALICLELLHFNADSRSSTSVSGNNPASQACAGGANSRREQVQQDFAAKTDDYSIASSLRISVQNSEGSLT